MSGLLPYGYRLGEGFFGPASVIPDAKGPLFEGPESEGAIARGQ